MSRTLLDSNRVAGRADVDRVRALTANERRLVGRWRATYRYQGILGPGVATFTVRFLGTRPTLRWEGITTQTEPGFFGPDTKSVYSAGTWFYVNRTRIRMTVQFSSVAAGVIQPSGQFLQVVFLNNNRFRSDNNVIFNRVR